VEILSGDGSQEEMQKFFNLFLLGSKRCKKLVLHTQELLDVTLQTLKQHSGCGNGIKELQVEIYKVEMLKTAFEVKIKNNTS